MDKKLRNSNLLTVLVLTVVFGLLASGTPSAVLAAPPSKSNCAQFDDVFERLACKQSAIADQVAYTSDEVFREDKKLNKALSETQIKNIRNAKDKTMRAKKKNDKAFFKRQAKSEARGNKQAGHLVPFDDVKDDVNRDGICDWEQEGVGLGENALCAAIELDSSGQLQPCNPLKKNKGKGKGGNPKFEGLECDRSTELEEPANADEEQDMIESAEELEASYDVVEDNLIEMNEALDTVNESGPAPAFTTATGCVIPASDPGLLTAAKALRYTQTISFGLARVMADVMGQTAFGFNARGGAAAFDSIATLARIGLNVVEDLQREESAELQVAIMECAAQSADAIAELQAEVTRLKALMQQEHDDIMAKLEEARAEIVDLLNTPQGQRSAFPQK